MPLIGLQAALLQEKALLDIPDQAAAAIDLTALTTTAQEALTVAALLHTLHQEVLTAAVPLHIAEVARAAQEATQVEGQAARAAQAVDQVEEGSTTIIKLFER